MSESNRRHAVALGLSKVSQQPRDSSPGDLPGAAVPGAGRAAPTPRLSMQVSLLVGHSQPGPSQPLSHTQAPLEQRPRSGGDSRDYLGSSAVPFPQPCLWLPHFLRGAQGLQRGFFLGCKQTPQHPPCLSASTESLPPITGHSTRRASATSPGHPVCATRPSTCPSWGSLGCSHRCRGSRRCAGTPGRRTRRRRRRSAGSGPRSSTGTSRTGTRPAPSTAPCPPGGCRLRCWGTRPGSTRTCPLAWGQRGR